MIKLFLDFIAFTTNSFYRGVFRMLPYIQQTRDVASTSIRRLYDVGDVVRRLIDVETMPCV